MTFDLGAALGGLFGLGSSIATAEYGKWDNIRTNDANISMNRETNAMNKQIADEANQLQLDLFNQQMDYTRQTQQTEWERADSSLQRAVADASKSGLSPLSVIASGGSPSGAIVSQPSAPNMHVPTMQAAQMNPLNPAYFLSMNDAARAAFDIIKDDRHMRSEEKIERLKQTEENYRFEKQLRATSALTNKRLNLENSRKSKELQEQIRQFNSNLELAVTEGNRRYAENTAKELTNYVKNITGDASGAYRYFKGTFDEYRLELRKWGNWYSDAVAKITADYESDSYNLSSGVNVSANGGNSSSYDGKLNGFSLGIGTGDSSSSNFGASSGASASGGETHTRSFATYLKQRLASEMADNPYPVWESDPYYRANPYY